MSYEYNKLGPSTIQYKKQTPNINILSHITLSIDQIPTYQGSLINLENIVELYQNGGFLPISQDQFNTYIFKISQSCFQSKKRLIAPFSVRLQEYLQTAKEYTKYIWVYVDLTSNNMSIQHFYFLYRKIGKMKKVDLIIRASDLFVLYHSVSFELFITQYKKSSKYIDKIILQDLESLNNQQMAPFQGKLFNLDKLSDAVTLFYYILKQSLTFVFDFKDQKSIFKNLIIKFKQLELDMQERTLDIYNLILSSMYQDNDLYELLTLKTDGSFNNQQYDTINRYRARQGLLSFLQSVYNQYNEKPVILWSQSWKTKNVPNDLVRFILGIQIPSVLQQSKAIIEQQSQPTINVKMLYKYGISFEQLKTISNQNQIHQSLIQYARQLFTIEQITGSFKYFEELIKTRVSPKISFIQVGAIAREEQVNLTQLSLIVPDKQLLEIVDSLDKLCGNEILVIKTEFKLLLTLKFKTLDIPVEINGYNNKNKGLILVKYTSTVPFWNSITKYLNRELLVVKKNTLISKSNQKVIPVTSEEQLFSLINMRFIERKFRNSFQISDIYIKNDK